jgi:Fe-S-cluster containining protein
VKPTRKAPARPDVVAEVRAIYRELAARPIERACAQLTECCRFRLTGRTPYLTQAEATVAAKAWRATGRKAFPEITDGSCPMLDPVSGRCRIYDSRPFGCRTHFCAAAGGPYARREVADLIHRLEDLSRPLGGQDALPLPAAVAAALRDVR